ncbi:unnamed protein product [Rotaria magnacalcarata]|uniref:Receptor for retinol uptake STRA6 n=1 Tax=Rotaria magnacalcarata TaxID=392030 RepID=A0A817AP66_9BILA|nr:unnamed protein product [Rotaria magnacalcarata]
MQTIVFSLFLLVTIDIIVQSSTCTSPVNLQNVDIVDITASWERFPTIIRKIKDVVDRFRCPKGWQRLGGSCYFISSIASASNEANSTCNLLYFNHSRLMQIRHPIELFYAADILIKNNFSSLMLNIHPQLLKRKHIDELLMNGQGEWQQMKENFREAQMKDYKSKTQILDELHAAGLSISRHSKKIKHIIHEKNRKAQIDHSALYEYDADEPIDGIQKRTKIPMQNPMKINKQKYYEDDIDSIDAADNFAQIKDVRSVCDQVIWNDIKNDSQVYILRTVLHADKIICSLSASKQDIEYNHVCEYDAPYFGKEHTSEQPLGTKKESQDRLPEDEENVTIDHEHRKHFMGDHANLESRHFTKAQEAAEYILPKTPQRFLNPKKNDLVRLCLVGGLNVFILSLLLILTAILHFMTFQNEIFHENKFNILLQDTIRIVTQRDRILNYRVENLIFAPIALVLIVIFSWSTKRERRCPTACNGRPSIIPPIQPFHTVNRFTTAAVFSLLTFEILKLFEELFGSIALSRDGVISFFLEYSAVFFLLGLRYYPILVSLQLSNVVNRFFAFLYIAAHVAYTIMRDGSCMHFLSRSQTYSVSEASKLHLELGNWFIIFGLLKNIPYFVLLSYIGAELTVRFAYDSIYVPYKKKRSIWLSSETRCEEFKFSRYYVKELFRRNNRCFSTVTTANKEIIHPTNRNDHKNEVKLLRQGEQSWMRKFLDRIYYLDNSFRFTTMAICTYSTTWVALYYLACTCIFWHISLTTEHVSYLKFYIESIFKTDCFLGVASCIIRLINATLFNLLFIGRLDYSLLGRPLEKFDSGFTAYVSYLHVEVAHTHPVMLAFCNLLYDDIIQRRPKHLCNHECSIGSSELDSDDNKSERVRPSKRESFTPNRISRRESNRHASRKNRSDDSDDENIERKNDIRLIGRKIKLSTTPLAHPSKNKKGFKPVKYNLDNDDVSGEEGSSIKIKSRTKGKNQSEIDFIKKMTATSLAVNANDSEDNEEIEVKQRKQQSQKMKNENSAIQPTMFEAYSTVSHLIDRNMMNESIKSSQKKQARFRWHLAYTLLNNYQLLGQRKGYPRRLRQTYAQRSNCLRGVDEYSAEPRPCIEERIFREDSSAKSISSDEHSAFVSSRRRSISVIEHSPRSSVKCYIDIQSSNYYNAAANKQKVNQQSLACPALSPNCSVAQAALNTNDDVQHIQSCSKKLARKLHKKGLHYHANESPPSESTVFTFSADTTIIAQKLTMTSKQQQQQTQCRTVVSDQRTSKSSFQLPYPSEQISSVPSIIDSNHQIQTVNENSKKKQATKTKFSAQNQKKPVECESK